MIWPGRPRWTAVVGWAAFAGACAWVLWCLLTFDPAEWAFPDTGEVAEIVWVSEFAMKTLVFTGLGALILTFQPGNRAGLLCLAPVATPLSDGLGAGYDWFAVQGLPTVWADWLFTVFFFLSYIFPFTFLGMFLPDGRLPHRRWRPVAWALVLAAAVESVVQMIPVQGETPEAWRIQFFVVSGWVFFAGTWAALLSLLHRLLRSRGRARAQVGWVMLGTWLLVLGRGFAFPPVDLPLLDFSWPLVHALRLAGLFSFATACGVAILRHDLVELNPLLRRLLLGVVLATVVTGCYLALTALMGSEPLPATLIAVGLALLTPGLYRWLRGGVTRLVYGRRGSPAEVRAAMTRRLATAAGPDEVLAVVADTVYDAVRVGGLQVVLGSAGRELGRATRGDATAGPAEEIPLTFQGAELGRMEIYAVGRRDPVDRALLVDLAGAAAAALAAAHRASELQRARLELITAREHERRRIARDLHDGVGPVLSGLGFALDSLRASVRHSPAEVVAGDARGQVRDALQLIRRLARDLRPPGVDQLGLIGAVRQIGMRHAGTHLSVEVTADELGDVGAATEVAAFAIMAEALTNVARHSGATRCSITLKRGAEALAVTVEDDGVGIGETPSGLGRASMIERAEELGGSCRIRTRPGGGTVVVAELPTGAPDSAARVASSPALPRTTPEPALPTTSLSVGVAHSGKHGLRRRDLPMYSRR